MLSDQKIKGYPIGYPFLFYFLPKIESTEGKGCL